MEDTLYVFRHSRAVTHVRNVPSKIIGNKARKVIQQICTQLGSKSYLGYTILNAVGDIIRFIDNVLRDQTEHTQCDHYLINAVPMRHVKNRVEASRYNYG